MTRSLSELVANLDDRSANLTEEIIQSISTLASRDEILGIVRRVGVLEGINQTNDGLKKFLRGDNESSED